MITDKEKQQAREDRILLVARIIKNKLPFCVKYKQPGSVWRTSNLPVTAFMHPRAWSVSTDMSLVEPEKPPVLVFLDEMVKLADGEIEKMKAMGAAMTAKGGCEHEVRARLIVKILDGDLPFEIQSRRNYPGLMMAEGEWKKAPMSAAHYFDTGKWNMRLAELQPRAPVRVKMGPDDLPTPCFIKVRNAGTIGVVISKSDSGISWRMPGSSVISHAMWEQLFASGNNFLWSDRAERPHSGWKIFSKPKP